MTSPPSLHPFSTPSSIHTPISSFFHSFPPSLSPSFPPFTFLSTSRFLPQSLSTVLSFHLSFPSFCSSPLPDSSTQTSIASSSQSIIFPSLSLHPINHPSIQASAHPPIKSPVHPLTSQSLPLQPSVLPSTAHPSIPSLLPPARHSSLYPSPSSLPFSPHPSLPLLTLFLTISPLSIALLPLQPSSTPPSICPFLHPSLRLWRALHEPGITAMFPQGASMLHSLVFQEMFAPWWSRLGFDTLSVFVDRT